MRAVTPTVSVLVLLLTAGCDGGASGPSSTLLDDPDGDGIVVAGSRVQIDLASERGQVLGEDGGFMHVSEARTIVANVAGSIRAFSDRCPHDDCPVDRLEGAVFRCSCDESAFTTSGTVANGPALSSLVRYSVSRSGDVITVILAPSEPQAPGSPNPTPPPYGY